MEAAPVNAILVQIFPVLFIVEEAVVAGLYAFFGRVLLIISGLYGAILGGKYLYNEWKAYREIEFYFFEINPATVTLLIAVIVLIAIILELEGTIKNSYARMFAMPMAFTLYAKTLAFCLK